MIEVVGISQLAVLEQSGERCLLFFYAKWQEDSLNADLRDQMSAMSVKYPLVKFLSLEAENFLQLTEKFRVSVVPTFIGTHGNVTVGRVEGANPSELLQLVKQLSAVQIQSGATTNASPSQVESVSDIDATLRKLINTAPVMLFMKGSPNAPQCGFSRQITDILKSNDIPFASFDILTDERVRSGLKKFSDWPTFPQLYVSGEFVGGLDIVKEIASSGNLASELGISKIQVPPPIASLQERILQLVNQAIVMVFIKGSPDAPQCGFSRTIVGILREENIEFSSFDILRDETIRAGLKTFSDWPTYPQLYVKGEFIGGLDVIKEMQKEGALKSQLGL